MNPRLPSVFSLIGTSWGFARKQPVLRSVVVWLLILPSAISNILTTVLQWNDDEKFVAFTDDQRMMLSFMIVGGVILFTLVIVWGQACVLVVAKRLLNTRAGRSRTSLKAVCGEGRHFIIPLLLTEILRGCITLLWTLLLIIPGIIYAVRTSFADVVVVGEGVAYRKALRRSAEVVRGKTWATLWRLVGVFLLLYVPLNLLSLLGYWSATEFGGSAVLVMDVIDGIINGPIAMLFTISTVVLYDTLKNA